MRQIDLKSAFGATPDSVEACIRRSLSHEKEIVKMRKVKVTLIAALIAIMVCGTALAATGGFRLSELFSNNETMKAKLDVLTQEVDKVYETDNVRIKVMEGLYASADSTVALALNVENKKPGEKFYLMVRNFTVNGEMTYGGQDVQFMEALLEDEPLVCGRRREIDGLGCEAGDVNVEFDYIILRVTGQILSREEVIALRDLMDDEDCAAYEARVRELTQAGYIVIEDDMVVEIGTHPDDLRSYAGMLIATGNFEMADQIHVSVPLTDAASASRIYEGEKSFRFDDLELVIDKLEVGIVRVPMEVRVIVDDPVKYEDYWLWVYDADNPSAGGKDKGFWANGTGTQSEFTLRADGRYESVYQSSLYLLDEMPRALEIRVGFLNPETGAIEECEGIRAVIHID